MRACVSACVRACVRSCVRAFVRACARLYVSLLCMNTECTLLITCNYWYVSVLVCVRVRAFASTLVGVQMCSFVSAERVCHHFF